MYKFSQNFIKRQTNFLMNFTSVINILTVRIIILQRKCFSYNFLRIRNVLLRKLVQFDAVKHILTITTIKTIKKKTKNLFIFFNSYQEYFDT